MNFKRRMRRKREQDAQAEAVEMMTAAMTKLASALELKKALEYTEQQIAEARERGEFEHAAAAQALVDQGRAQLDEATADMAAWADSVLESTGGPRG